MTKTTAGQTARKMQIKTLLMFMMTTLMICRFE